MCERQIRSMLKQSALYTNLKVVSPDSMHTLLCMFCWACSQMASKAIVKGQHLGERAF